MNKAQEISDLAEQARELVENLKALKERAGHYSTATASLDEARGRLGKLVEETGRLASATHQTLQKLDQLGVASIVERLTSLEAAQSERFERVREQVAEVQTQLASLEESQKGVASTVEGLTNLERAQSERLERVREQVAKFQTQLTGLDESLKSQRVLTVALVIGNVAVLALIIVVLMKAH